MAKKELSERTKAEMEAGKRRVIMYQQLERVANATDKLKDMFPRLWISTTADFENVKLVVSRKRKDVVGMDDAGENMFFEVCPIKDFPTEYMITKLMLAS